MLTACEKCLAKHQLDMSTVIKPTVKYRCKSCRHVNVVSNPEFESPHEEIIEPQAPETNEEALPSGQASEPLSDYPPQPRPSTPRITGFSIKAKITMIIVALVVVSLSTVGFIATTKGSRALSTQAEKSLKLITGQKAKEYNNIFGRLQDEIEGVAIYAEHTFARDDISKDLGFRLLMPWTGSSYGNPNLNATLTAETLALQRVGIALQGLVRKNPYLELGYMATENNVFVADNEDVVGVIEAEIEYQPKKRSWYMGAVEKKETIWTQPYIDVNTKKLIVSCAAPVFLDNKKLIGVVGFDVLLDTIQTDIISLDIGYDSQAFLLGKTGSLLAKPGMSSKNFAWDQTVKTDNALETDNPEFRGIVKSMMAGETGIGTHTEDGNRIIVAYAPLPAIDASVGIVVSEKEVMKPAAEIRKIIIGVWVAVVFISVIVGLMIGNGITGPINNLAMRAELISQGQMDLEEIPNRRTDEIGVLIESFNRLVTSLKIAMSRTRR
jgi:HAMP domain-containing protein